MKLIGGFDEAAVTRRRPEYFQRVQGGETVGSGRHGMTSSLLLFKIYFTQGLRIN
jgi:hypothetical protein